MAQATMSFSTAVETSADTSMSYYTDMLVSVIKTFGPELVFCTVTFFLAVSMRGLRRGAGGSGTSPKKQIPKVVPGGRNTGRNNASLPPMHSEKRSTTTPQASSMTPLPLSQLVDQAISIRLSTAKTLAYYDELRAAGKHLTLDQDLRAAGSKHTAVDFYAALVQCAGRAGRPQVVENLLDDMAQVGITRNLAIYESAMRLLAGKKHFKEAINVYDRLEKDGLKPSPTTLSCLVGFASELGELDRAIYFFNLLEEQDVPSVRACMCVLRVYGKRKDWTSSVQLLRRITKRGAQVDSIVFNIVLATGISVGEVDEALELLNEEPGTSVADVVSYNIILKGLAQIGKVDRAISILEGIVEKGVQPNLITFNTAMDAAVRAHRSDDAWRLYYLMVREGRLTPDKCTCSTLVKGLYQHHDETEERVKCILNLIDGCIDDCSIVLRNSLLSGALEAACRLPNARLAMRAFAKMQEYEIPASASELRALALTTAKAKDIEGCKAVWLRIVDHCSELQSEKIAFDKLVRQGQSIDAATLQCVKEQ